MEVDGASDDVGVGLGDAVVAKLGDVDVAELRDVDVAELGDVDVDIPAESGDVGIELVDVDVDVAELSDAVVDPEGHIVGTESSDVVGHVCEVEAKQNENNPSNDDSTSANGNSSNALSAGSNNAYVDLDQDAVAEDPRHPGTETPDPPDSSGSEYSQMDILEDDDGDFDNILDDDDEDGDTISSNDDSSDIIEIDMEEDYEEHRGVGSSGPNNEDVSTNGSGLSYGGISHALKTFQESYRNQLNPQGSSSSSDGASKAATAGSSVGREEISRVDGAETSAVDGLKGLEPSKDDLTKDQDQTMKMSPLNKWTVCHYCSEPATNVCGYCFKVGYCSEKHQVKDWKDHRLACCRVGLYRSPYLAYEGPFRIERDQKSSMESYSMVAGCDILPAAKIMEETPFLICPWPRTTLRKTELQLMKGLAVRCLTCFGCCKYIGFGFVQCRDCKLPLCSEDCMQIDYHRKNECKLMKVVVRKGKSLPFDMTILTKDLKAMELLYTDTMIVRLIIKLSDVGKAQGVLAEKELWAKLCLLFNIKMKEREEDRDNGKAIFDTLKASLPMSFLCTHDNKRLVWKVFCLIQENSFKFDLPFRRFNALCTILNNAGHSCIPNSHAYIKEPESKNHIESRLEDLTVVLMAGQNIAKGSQINFAYCPLIFGTRERRERLMESHLMWCMCKRCMDPTECGTHLSSLNCSQCSLGRLVPPLCVVQSNPNTETEEKTDQGLRVPWICDSGRLGKCKSRTQVPTASSTELPTQLIMTCSLTLIMKTFYVEQESVKFLGRLISATNFDISKGSGLLTKNHNIYIKLLDDILRGALFPLADLTLESVEEFDTEQLAAVVSARKKYKLVMTQLNPAFNFEGFPTTILDFMENEFNLRKSESSKERIDRIMKREPAQAAMAQMAERLQVPISVPVPSHGSHAIRGATASRTVSNSHSGGFTSTILARASEFRQIMRNSEAIYRETL